MKTSDKRKFILIMLPLMLAFMMAMPSSAVAAQPPVLLGTTDVFAVLAGSTITNTGPTTIVGDIGLFPGTAFTGSVLITQTGEEHIKDAVAEKAKDDLVTAYNDAEGRKPVTRIATELGGKPFSPVFMIPQAAHLK